MLGAASSGAAPFRYMSKELHPCKCIGWYLQD